MGTRAKIKIKANGHYLCVKYFHMDGHVENWVSTLITALKQTHPATFLESSALLAFMLDDDESDDYLDYLCDIDIADNTYHIKLYGYDKNILFDGMLNEFAAKYNFSPQ